MDKKAYYNTGHCPNREVAVTRERGDFQEYEEHGRKFSRYVVYESWVEYVPCNETRYEEFDNYSVPIGFDPAAKRVQCVKCGMKYWLFPRISVKSEVLDGNNNNSIRQ